jgi:hypothetical protein
MMEKIKNVIHEVEHYWIDHKKVVIVFGIVLVVAIIM